LGNVRRRGCWNIEEDQSVNPGSSLALEQQTHSAANRAADDNERPITERLSEARGVVDKVVKPVTDRAAA